MVDKDTKTLMSTTDMHKLWEKDTDISKILPVKAFICSWCGGVFPEKGIYYQCIIHNRLFCHDCATNHGQREIEHRHAVRCEALQKQDCIMEKRVNHTPL